MKTLTLFDFHQFKDSFSFEKDRCLIAIDKLKSKEYSVWLQISDRPSQGRVAKTLNEAVAIANRMYLYYLNKTNNAQNEG